MIDMLRCARALTAVDYRGAEATPQPIACVIGGNDAHGRRHAFSPCLRRA